MGQKLCDVIYGQPPSRDSRNGDYLPNPKKTFCVNFDDVVCSKKNHSQNVRDVQKQLILRKKTNYIFVNSRQYFILYSMYIAKKETKFVKTLILTGNE